MADIARLEFERLVAGIPMDGLGSIDSPLPLVKPNTAVSQEQYRESGLLVWTQASEITEPEGKERTILRNGLVRLDLFSSPRMLLKWDGRVPNNLRPQDDPDMLVEKFLPWVFQSLPRKMGLYRRTSEGTRKYYKETTDFDVTFADGSARKYNLSEDKGMVGFSQAFTRRADEIERMVIFGGKTPGGDRHFGLELNYRPGVLLREAMSLSWQVNSGGVKACNGAMTEWVLRNVSGGDQLGDLAQPSLQMAEILREKTRASIRKK